ncbi:MAG: alpha/beta hydrolase [Clostridia bacterium]|nr:alpha/beta hydrolase [Clostridia bacterium]
MAKAKKALKTAATCAGVAAGTYFAAGALITEGVLSRWGRINSKPDEILNDPGLMRAYLQDENFRKADDWYINAAREELKLVNRRNETLHAELVEAAEESHLWLVLLHGYSSRPRMMAKQGVIFNEMGYNVLIPYLRGHRKSEQNFCSMGYYDKDDVADWIQYIVSIDPTSQIVVMGCSMGGATTMLVTGEDLPENVKCAIEDCGYTNCFEEFKAQIGEILHLPSFPFLNAANAYSRLVHGWDFRDCSPIDAVARSKTPTLFIHGIEDTFVPYSMLAEVYDACAAEKDILEVPDAKHDESCAKHPEIYWPKIKEFIAKYVK